MKKITNKGMNMSVGVAVCIALAAALYAGWMYVGTRGAEMVHVVGSGVADQNSSVTNDVNSEQEDAVIKILAVGDSLTAGYGLNLYESYPAQLEKSLDTKRGEEGSREGRKYVQVINAGVSGETSAGLLERADFIVSQKPDMLLITIGGNDALRAIPLAATRKNLYALLERFRQVVPGNKILLMNIAAPENQGRDYVRDFEQMHKDVVAEYGVQLVPFVVPEVFTSPKLMQADGVHPNAEGYAYIVERYILPRVVEALWR
jgi:acyl-CoA thioesterase-1